MKLTRPLTATAGALTVLALLISGSGFQATAAFATEAEGPTSSADPEPTPAPSDKPEAPEVTPGPTATPSPSPTAAPEETPPPTPSADPEPLTASATAAPITQCNSKFMSIRDGGWLFPGIAYKGNFADPFVLPVKEAGGTVYYAFATNTSQRNLPVMKSTDLKTWSVISYTSNSGWAESRCLSDYDPLDDTAIPAEIRQYNYNVQWKPETNYFPNQVEAWLNVDGLVSARPSWAAWVPQAGPGALGWRTQETWAPGVAYFNGKYHAYMSVRANGTSDRFCIGLATSTNPGGPYRYISGNSAVVCPTDYLNGVIDPEPVNYGGKWYLLWKSEYSPGKAQGLHAQEIDVTTGRLKAGTKKVDLLYRDTSATTWEHHAIENPSMATIGGTTYLFYAGGEFWAKPGTNSNYATGYAVCPKGPTAPCKRPSGDNRLLGSLGSVQGPGGGSAFQAADGTWKFAYHAYTQGGDPDTRQLRIANIYRWQAGQISISDGAKARFADVPAHYKFASQIGWLANKGITTGNKDGNFLPQTSTTRSDMAAFLYRYAGSPAYTPKGAEPFADVSKKNNKFYKEIRWMHAMGLSTGSRNPNGGKALYKPGDAISREAMAAFLYRLSRTKNYTPKGKEPLLDVNRQSKFYREIRWMYDNKITTGYSQGNGTYVFDEKGNTNRDAFAAFLQRYDSKFG
ncbi:family 43 glycosylhydrolase [Leucobacter viscericola]|uniref:Family 43 glycosylhydrolase n=1 Tax=Leucobacter viscericola TaxID=2714935 RepID=A0A6G7XF52_9MICO|nr:family 43 glycosylhydrolase [Leucobacter viscericola]QIK63027.1 family 43 glycosylhydrolase [Leucobacter viscericola]